MDKVLIQQCMQGTEYALDSVSFDGQHYITSIWKYKKGPANGCEFIYYSSQLLSSLSQEEETLCTYLLQCLDALGISHGAAHTEIMLTDKGPFLIELNARMHGSLGPVVCAEHIGYGQIDRLALMHADPEQFKKTTPPRHPFPKKSFLGVLLISPCEGIFNGFRNLEKIQSCRTFQGFHPSITPGHPIAKTIDLATVPARVMLVGSPEELERDHERIREWECDAFDVTPHHFSEGL